MLPALVLFDIDGTLVSSTPTHLHALAEAITVVTGVSVSFELDAETPRLDGRVVSGWIDVQCLRAVAQRAGMAVTEELRATFAEEYHWRYTTVLDAGAPVGAPLADADAVLTALSRRGSRSRSAPGTWPGSPR